MDQKVEYVILGFDMQSQTNNRVILELRTHQRVGSVGLYQAVGRKIVQPGHGPVYSQALLGLL
jgi:hypothetical protein